MSYIEFDKEQLVNINFSKAREILRCSKSGSFASTTLLGLNTRKYHGLFIVPQDNLDGERHVLVSNLNETITVDSMDFRIGIHQYKGGFIDPKGNKYLQKFTADAVPTYHYRVGKFCFTKELLLCHDADRVLLRYTIDSSSQSPNMQFSPLLAFRQIHQLTHQNEAANTQYKAIENGVSFCLYDNYTPVCFQASVPLNYEHNPVWYKDFEYEEELKRGYDGHEDLLNPGKITVPVKNQEFYICIGTEPIAPSEIETLFHKEQASRATRTSFSNCLLNAADQFIVNRNGKTSVIAGYPWFGRWGRDTFIALPGLTLAVNKPELCKKIMDDMLSEVKEGLFPNIGVGEDAAYNSVDAPLWFMRTLQQYTKHTKSDRRIWKEYGDVMKSILEAYRKGSMYNIKMLDNGLIYAGGEGVALTWMDAVVDGVPVTPRTGCQVEINALWYNAIRFAIQSAKWCHDLEFVTEWESIAKDFPVTFKETFWSKEHGYLADYVNGDYKNFQVRPNMIIAAALPYSPISDKIKQLVLKRTRDELLTKKGLRTLSPCDPAYKGIYGGDQKSRDAAYHQGTCWPWLLGPFADAMVAVYRQDAYPVLENILYEFDACMFDYGISTIAEITDGNPPYKPNGCISQAWSVSALLYIKHLLAVKAI